MQIYTNDDIRSLVEENDIKFIRLQFVDIFGRTKNVAITSERLEQALNGDVLIDGGSIEGFLRMKESEMYLKPDPNTFQIFPWRPQMGRVARMICDVYNIDDTPFDGCPRNVLKKAVSEAKDMGYLLNVAPECEFFLFLTDKDGNPTTITHDKASYFDLGPIDMGENCRRDICLALEKMGFKIEASHHETAPGQHEISFKEDNVLITADNIVTFKLVVKAVAQRHGLHATFMPKPLQGKNGSGLHLLMKLIKDGDNVFSSNDTNLKDESKWFIGGLLKNIKEITAVTNPLVNSYKRLVSGYEAPVNITWSDTNRSNLIKIVKGRNNNTRIELRSPDATCNPYLALSLILKAGLEGIKNKIEPPVELKKEILDKDNNIKYESLPQTLIEALAIMNASELCKAVLGNHVFEKYIEAKSLEWNNYNASVHKWESEEYLLVY